jgi:hypothetical protein
MLQTSIFGQWLVEHERRLERWAGGQAWRHYLAFLALLHLFRPRLFLLSPSPRFRLNDGAQMLELVLEYFLELSLDRDRGLGF